MILKTTDFSGMLPILAPYRLAENFAQEAVNCKFVDGDLCSFFKNSDQVAGPFPYDTKSMYWYDRKKWITRTVDMDIVESAIVNDTLKRIYKTESGVRPEMSFGANAGTVWFDLGVPAPEHGPTAVATLELKSGLIAKILSTTEYGNNPNQSCSEGTCATSGTGPLVVRSVGHNLETGDRVKINGVIGASYLNGNVYSVSIVDENNFALNGTTPNASFAYEGGGSWSEYRDEGDKETRAYCYTFVTDQGEEGAPSPLTEIEVYSDSSVQLTDMPGYDGDMHISFFAAARKRIYRSVTSATGTNLHFIGEINYVETDFLDNVDPASIGEPLPSESWDVPPADLSGIVSMPNGIIAGFSGREICFSVPYIPHAWPIEYRINVDSDIVALGVFGQSMVVATKERPYIVTGTDSASMTLEKMEINQSCVSKRGLVDMGYSVIYPSPDGLIEVSRSGVRNLTVAIFSREQWQALEPDKITAFSYEGKYFFSTGSVTYLFDPVKPTLTKLDFYPKSGFTDLQEDKLYLLIGQYLYVFEGGDPERQTYKWHGKLYRHVKPNCFSCAQVFRAPEGDVTFSLYVDGDKKFEKEITDNEPFRLPGDYLGVDFEYRLEGTAKVYFVAISDSVSELKAL